MIIKIVKRPLNAFSILLDLSSAFDAIKPAGVVAEHVHWNNQCESEYNSGELMFPRLNEQRGK